jgi:hypothetical protein
MSTFDQLLGKLSELVGGEDAPTNAMAGARDVAESLDPRVTYRASMLPVGNFDDGSVGMVWPQSAVDAKNAFGRFHRGEAPQPEDAVLAGLAMTGAGAFGLGRSAVSRGSVAGAERAEASSGLPSIRPEAGSAPVTARVYRGTGYPDADTGPTYFASDSPQIAATYAEGPNPSVIPSDMTFRNPLTLDAAGGSYDAIPGHGSMFNAVEAAKKGGNDGLVIRNIVDPMKGYDGPPATTYAAIGPGTVKSATTGETLFSNPKDAAPAGLLATGEGEEAPAHHARAQPRNPSGQFVTSDSFDGRLHAFQKVLVDLDGDGIPDAVADAPPPTNAMLGFQKAGR